MGHFAHTNFVVITLMPIFDTTNLDEFKNICHKGTLNEDDIL